MKQIPEFEVVDDPVAEDKWSYIDVNGEARVSRITIGRPRRWPNDVQGDWLCPLEIEHFTDGVHAVAGVGPVDALMNAMRVVKAFADEIGKFCAACGVKYKTLRISRNVAVRQRLGPNDHNARSLPSV
jgi:hypothetical protein